MTQKRQKIVAASCVAAFLLLTGLVFWFVGRPLVAFASEPDRFRDWVDQSGVWGRLAFLGMVVLQVFVAIIPGEPLEIAAGYTFGVIEGTVLCIAGMTIGSILVFLFVRRFGVRAVEVFLSREKINSLRFLQNSRRLHGFVIVAFLLPGTPKDVLSYCVGLTKLPLAHWLWISALCRIPSVLTSTIGGNALGTGQHQMALVVFAVTAVVSLLGLVVYETVRKRKEAAGDE